jgi:hypothetical protein
MKSIYIAGCCILSVVAIGAVISSTHYAGIAGTDQRLIKQLQSQVQTDSETIANDDAVISSNQEASASMQTALNQAALNLDDAHPLMLKYLGTDAAAAKFRQFQLDKAWAAETQAQRVQAIRDEQAEEAKTESENRMLQEQRKADAIAQTAAAAQEQADAEKEKADAAMLEAEKPPVQIINQNQQNQPVIFR